MDLEMDNTNCLWKSKRGNNIQKYISKREKIIEKENMRRKDLEYKIGDKVWLEGEAWRRSTLNSQQIRKTKLRNQRGGPFIIRKNLTTDNYELMLRSTYKGENKFHVLLLKRYRGDQLENNNKETETGDKMKAESKGIEEESDEDEETLEQKNNYKDGNKNEDNGTVEREKKSWRNQKLKRRRKKMMDEGNSNIRDKKKISHN